MGKYIYNLNQNIEANRAKTLPVEQARTVVN